MTKCGKSSRVMFLQDSAGVAGRFWTMSKSLASTSLLWRSLGLNSWCSARNIAALIDTLNPSCTFLPSSNFLHQEILRRLTAERADLKPSYIDFTFIHNHERKEKKKTSMLAQIISLSSYCQHPKWLFLALKLHLVLIMHTHTQKSTAS